MRYVVTVKATGKTLVDREFQTTDEAVAEVRKIYEADEYKPEDIECQIQDGIKVEFTPSPSILPKHHKPRADKGVPRVAIPKKKGRKKLEYFIVTTMPSNGPMTRAEAEEQLGKGNTQNITLIAGHEVKFSHKIQFQFKV